jgi:methyl-accepting chemotaxis protein
VIEFLRNLKLTHKLVVLLLFVGLVPAIVTSLLAEIKAEALIEEQASNNLVSVREGRKQAVTRYLNLINDQVTTMASQKITVQAMKEFGRDFASYSNDPLLVENRSDRKLKSYYRDQFGREYRQQNNKDANISSVFNQLPDYTKALQSAYISENPNPLGEKGALNRAEGPASYHETHAKYHAEIRQFLETYNYYDIFLVELDEGNVVYSVFKELDFATSLKHGPYRDTNFADAFRIAATRLDKGQTTLQDYELYYPSYSAPASFIATPVFDGQTKVGVLVFQMPIDDINNIMSERAGMGESGEAYIVGEDLLMRSDSYLDPEHHSVISSFRNPETGSVKSEATLLALSGKSGAKIVTDYNGNPVFSAYTPLNVLGMKWALLAEIDVAEALGPVTQLRNRMLTVLVFSLVIVAIVAVMFGRFLSGPMVALSATIQKITKTGDFSLRVDQKSDDEIGLASKNLNELFLSLGDCFTQMKTVLNDISNNSFNSKVNDGFHGDMAVLADGVNQTVSRLDQLQQDQVAQSNQLEESAAQSEKLMKKAQDEAVTFGRIKQALDACSTNIMIANADHDIVYTNDAVQSMMKVAEKDIRTELPSFDASQLLGSNIDIFHKKPSHQRAMLAALTQAHETQIKLGGRTFDLIANPVNSASGERIGTVVEWNDVTLQLAQQKKEQRIANENARIKQALDACSTNVMIGDADNNIIYMNESVANMMRNVESDLRTVLPDFNASSILGQNIDFYHKNPAHQRSMLSKLTSTYETQISVAGRTFALVANPIINEDQERLGTVVEWNDLTQEIKAQTEVDALIQSAAKGDYSSRISLEGKQGFFENIAKSLNTLVDTTDVAINEVVNVLEALASGDLTRSIEGQYEGAFGKLKEDMNGTVLKLTSVVNEVQTSCKTVSTAADELAQGNNNLSQRTEEQASSLEETASSMEEMTASVKQNEQGAKQAATLAQQAQLRAEEGGNVVYRAVEAMDDISHASNKISDIIGVIDEIAFQTNLLALNAAVEAARAGEQGKGFAVVAGEVRNLAQRSAGAAKEIKDLISDSVAKVGTGTQLVNESGETLKVIVEAVNKVDEVIQGIASGAAEQASGINQVNVAVAEMDTMTQQNAALVEEAAAASESMAEQSNKMRNALSFFKVKE